MSHFKTLKIKNMTLSQYRPSEVLLSYILGDLDPGGAKNVVGITYFGHFRTLIVKKWPFFIDSQLVIALGYILGELAPGGTKNEVGTTYFGAQLAKYRSL